MGKVFRMSNLHGAIVCKLVYLKELQLNISSVRTYACCPFLMGKAPVGRGFFNLYIQYSGWKVTTTPGIFSFGVNMLGCL
jgi:hypothetical protein